jgi:hypothetical protein
VAKAFAVACAAEGHSPDDAIAAFPLKGDSIEQAIRQAFEQLQSQDSNPRVVQLKASALVEGVQIPIKQWYQFWK